MPRGDRNANPHCRELVHNHCIIASTLRVDVPAAAVWRRRTMMDDDCLQHIEGYDILCITLGWFDARTLSWHYSLHMALHMALLRVRAARRIAVRSLMCN